MRVRHLTLVGLLAVMAWNVPFALPSAELRDYGSFIASGRAGAAGENPYAIHPLTFHVVLPGFDVWNPNLNPPVSIPVFAWFDQVDPHRGFRWWWGFSLVCYLAAVGLLAWRHRANETSLLLAWALALAGFWDTLALGQIYLPLVLAAVASWLLLERGRPLLAGLLMGVVVAVKPNFAVWPALLLLAGHWRAPAAAATTAVLLSAAPLIGYGTEIYAQWVNLIVSDRDRAAFLTNASILGIFQRAGAATLGKLASVALLAALAVWAVRARPDVHRATTLGILGGIAASPIAWVHYTLFLLPAFFAARRSTPLLVSAALLVVPVPLLLRLLDAPTWQQVTAGSAYNWAVLLALAGFGGAALRSESRDTSARVTLVFYDGVCGLCDRFVHFLVSRDRRGALRFAPLQGELARRELVPAGHDPADLNSVLVVADWGTPDQRVHSTSRAILHAVRQLGGGWGLAAHVAAVVPTPLADALYRFVARRRYRLFGRLDACPLPRPEWRARFIDTEPVRR